MRGFGEGIGLAIRFIGEGIGGMVAGGVRSKGWMGCWGVGVSVIGWFVYTYLMK